MSLKARLAVTLTIAFLVILAIGSVLTFRLATENIAAELTAARSVASNRVAQLIAELPASRDVPGKLASFVRAFNGDRHVQIMLIDATGAVRSFSLPAQDGGALPSWFVQLLAPDPSVTVMPLSGSALPMTGAVVSIDPRNELADTWTELSVGFAILSLFVLIAFVAVWVVADRSLRPLDSIQAGFGRIGKGDYGTAVEAFGPPEMRALAAGFNKMSNQLDEVSARNRRLSEQLLRLQDEERADLARDLHDEVGPLLFAIDVDASAIARLARRDGTQAPLAERAEAIKQAAHRARREVRRILGDLRPGLLPGLGLKVAVETMLEELARRHPEVAFVADIADGDWGGATETLLQRVIREAVNNALRHGHPTRIAVRVAPKDGRLCFEIVDDGGGLPAGGPVGGFGLIGMRERLEAAGGELAVSQVALPPGVRLTGNVPLGDRAAADDAADEGERAA
ncbi:HAMP domain-containing protein [Aurantimonas aggregata]|uniref:HAMP domain-containing protein n=1 Tax=Aurantimonas aggregata TaxID=2047720 RepID=A0A6L9MHT0_9HYPH|nr:HAMP domain-containing protein [Aurantimonas aggregata]